MNGIANVVLSLLQALYAVFQAGQATLWSSLLNGMLQEVSEKNVV